MKSNSQGAGNSFANGDTPASKNDRDSGWVSTRRATFWDYVEGRIPA
jgi:hypothetical protein